MSTQIKSGFTYGKALEMWLEIKKECELFEKCYPKCEPDNCPKIIRRAENDR